MDIFVEFSFVYQYTQKPNQFHKHLKILSDNLEYRLFLSQHVLFILLQIPTNYLALILSIEIFRIIIRLHRQVLKQDCVEYDIYANLFQIQNLLSYPQLHEKLSFQKIILMDPFLNDYNFFYQIYENLRFIIIVFLNFNHLSMQFPYDQLPKPKNINELWMEVERGIDREKMYRKQQIQQQLNILEQKLLSQKPIHQQKIAMLKQQIQKQKDKLSKQAQDRMQVQNDFSQQIRQLQENFGTQMEKQRIQRQQQMDNCIRQADQKLLNICQSMQSATNEKGQTIEAITEKMQQKIILFEENIINQRKKRQESSTQLTESIQRQLNRLHGDLDNQKRLRQGTNKKILLMIQDIQKKLEEQINQQRKARQQTNSAMHRLLQQTCKKLQSAFL